MTVVYDRDVRSVRCFLTILAGLAASVGHARGASARDGLQIAEADESGEIKTKTSLAKVDLALTLETSADGGVHGTFRVEHAQTAPGKLVDIGLQWSLGDAGTTGAGAERPLDLDPPRSVPLHLRASLPGDGEYRLRMRATHSGVSQDFFLTVTRAREAMGIEVSGLSLVQTEGLSTRPRVEFTVQETAGRGRSLRLPQLESLVRKSGATRTQVSRGLSRIEVDGADAGSLELGDGQFRRVSLELVPPGEAGEYEGTFALTAEGAIPVIKSFTLQTREDRWWALVCLFIGALVSTGLRVWVKTWRPSEVRTNSLLALYLKLGESQPPREDVQAWRSFQRLRGQLSSALRLDPTPGDEVMRSVGFLTEAFPLFLQARGVARALGAKVPPGLQAALAAAEAAFVSAPADASSTVLVPLRTALGAALGAAVSAVTDRTQELERRFAAFSLTKLPALELLRAAKAAKDDVRTATTLVFAEQEVTVAAARNVLGILHRLGTHGAPPEWLEERERLQEKLGALLSKASAGEDVWTEVVTATEDAARSVAKQADASHGPPTILQQVEDALGQKHTLQGLQLAAARLEPPANRQPFAALGTIRSAEVDQALDSPDIQEVSRRLRGHLVVGRVVVGGADAIVAIVSLAAAIGTGWSALWLSSPTWGGLNDCLLAVLWGLGAAQIGGSAFAGVDAMTKKLTS